MSNHPVMVCGELGQDGAINPVTFELLGAGRKIADDLGTELALVLIGGKLADAAGEAAHYGANKVYTIEHPLLESFQADLWVEVLEKICQQTTPKVLLMTHSFIGMEVAPRLAFRLKTKLTTDCLELDVDKADGLLRCTKAVYGGNATAILKHTEEPQFATVRRKVVCPAERIDAASEIVDSPPAIDESMIKVTSVKTVMEEAVALDSADAIVCGGRGIGSLEGFKELEELAALLKDTFGNVEIGGSRPAIDLGWLSSNRQIGLTGEKVSPVMYIAVGISGATQHLAGMMRSKQIVAINTDAKCSIFKVANLGVVGDYKLVLPAFKKKWKELS